MSLLVITRGNKKSRSQATVGCAPTGSKSSERGNMASSWGVWLALVVIQLGFGAYGVVVSKFAKESNADPLVFSLIRDAGAFPVLLLAAVIAEKRLQFPAVRELPLFALLGLAGMFGNQLFYILGVYYTNANIASIFQPAIPVWTALLAIITRIEAFPPIRKLRGWAKILGIVLAAAGASTMSIKSGTGGSSNSTEAQGYIFLLANTLSMAIYILLQKKLIFNKEDSPWKTKPVTVTAWSYMFGSMYMAIASLYYVNKPEKFSNIPTEEIYPIIYAIFIASALCYLLITWCNMQISSSLVTATWPLQVLFCAVLSYLVLNEVMTGLQYAGGALIILGLLGVAWSNYAEEKEIEENKDDESYGYVRVSQDEEGFISEADLKTATSLNDGDLGVPDKKHQQ